MVFFSDHKALGAMFAFETQQSVEKEGGCGRADGPPRPCPCAMSAVGPDQRMAAVYVDVRGREEAGLVGCRRGREKERPLLRRRDVAAGKHGDAEP
mmetsp:Transcript_2589/g.7723  ORF Transcript_2589/g.7723 Transcript_2589/m.7723 type:complete len:96 (-) Transcript_2589:930-1217(-)